MGLTLVTPATDTPVTLAEAKAWCRVDGTADDDALNMSLAAATGQVEDFTGKALAEQTWLLALDDFSDVIELPRGPVLAVTSITYLDATGDEQLLDPSIYTLDLVSNPQRIVRNCGESWPEVSGAVNAVSIVFTAGYATLPAPIKMSILMLVAQWFDNRAGVQIGNIVNEIPFTVTRLLSPFRRMII